MSADGDSDQEVAAILLDAGAAPVVDYDSGGSLGASLGSSRVQSSLSGVGSSGRGDRPPSSYGSMKSDDAVDDDDDPNEFKPPPSVVVTVRTRRVIRADSPETTFTEATNTFTCKSTIPREGVILNKPSGERTGGEMIDEEEEEEEEKNEEGAEGGDEEEEDEEMEQRTPSPPPAPPEPPAEGLGLQFGPIHEELSLPFIFKSLQNVLAKLSVMELMWFKRSVAQRNRGKVNQEQLMDCDVLDVVDYLIEHFGQGGGLKLAITTLHLIDRRPPAEELELRCRRVLIRHELQEHHKRHYEVVFEGVARPGEQAGLNRIFTEPQIVEGGYRGVNTEHEVLRDVKPKYGEPRRAFRLNDVLRSFPGAGEAEGERVRVAVLSGVPMSGLSYAAHKITLDWSHDATNQDLHFLFYLNCQDLRHYAEESLTLLKLLTMFHHALDGILPLLKSADTPCALVLEGWEDRRPLLDMTAPPVTDVTTEAPLAALMASLLRGDLMPHMRIIVTCRRSDLYLLPREHVDRLLELRGYLPEHRDDFFAKHYDRDLSVSAKVLQKVKESPTLYAMSHLPLFAWIVVWVFERNVRRKPTFLTRAPHETPFMIDIVLVMVNRWQERYRGNSSDHTRWKDEEKLLLKSVGRFSLRMLEARRNQFHPDDFKEYDLEPRKLLNVGLFTDELPEWTPGSGGGAGGAGGGGGGGGAGGGGKPSRPTYVFLHHSLQEFMAAFYIYLAFRSDGRNVFEQQLKSSVVAKLVKERPILDLLRPAVDRALASPDGHLDLMLRFLCGMAMDSTEDHLRGTMLPHRNPPPKGMDDAMKFIRKRMETAQPERRRNLELCLNEMVELDEDKQDNRHMGF